jgi:hypothetical protein
VKTTTNKQLLISESYDDSNQCIPCRKKPDQTNQHNTTATRTYCSCHRVTRFDVSRQQIKLVAIPTTSLAMASLRMPRRARRRARVLCWPLTASVPTRKAHTLRHIDLRLLLPSPSSTRQGWHTSSAHS